MRRRRLLTVVALCVGFVLLSGPVPDLDPLPECWAGCAYEPLGG